MFKLLLLPFQIFFGIVYVLLACANILIGLFEVAVAFLGCSIFLVLILFILAAVTAR